MEMLNNAEKGKFKMSIPRYHVLETCGPYDNVPRFSSEQMGSRRNWTTQNA